MFFVSSCLVKLEPLSSGPSCRANALRQSWQGLVQALLGVRNCLHFTRREAFIHGDLRVPPHDLGWHTGAPLDPHDFLAEQTEKCSFFPHVSHSIHWCLQMLA